MRHVYSEDFINSQTGHCHFCTLEIYCKNKKVQKGMLSCSILEPLTKFTEVNQ